GRLGSDPKRRRRLARGVRGLRRRGPRPARAACSHREPGRRRSLPLRAEPDVPRGRGGHPRPGGGARALGARPLRGPVRRRRLVVRPLVRGAVAQATVRPGLRRVRTHCSRLVAATAPVNGLASFGAVRNTSMAVYTKKNLKEVENQAPKFGMPDELDARFARSALDGKTLGLTRFELAPNFRIPFGHKHAEQEEVYVIVRGSARIKVDDEIVDLGEWDAIRFDKDTMRDVEAGPEGVEYLAFSAGNDPQDAEMVQGWWPD